MNALLANTSVWMDDSDRVLCDICGCTSEPDFSPVWTKIYISGAAAEAKQLLSGQLWTNSNVIT